MTFNVAQLADATYPQDSKAIKKECLRLLTRRDHSRKEIEAKLAHKGFDQALITEAINELAIKGWQDDKRYAESYARSRNQKGFGPLRIAYELKQQGVSPDTIDTIVNSETEWMALLVQAYHKKYPNPTALDPNERAKRIRFLQQRGFPNAMISVLLKQLNQ